eukprot:3273916-Rhodomonas_salina.2
MRPLFKASVPSSILEFESTNAFAAGATVTVTASVSVTRSVSPGPQAPVTVRVPASHWHDPRRCSSSG